MDVPVLAAGKLCPTPFTCLITGTITVKISKTVHYEKYLSLLRIHKKNSRTEIFLCNINKLFITYIKTKLKDSEGKMMKAGAVTFRATHIMLYSS